MSRTILHVDMNNFYASVECRMNPELMNKPVAVCGDAEQRHGIVLAKNYLAKGAGVVTGDVIWQAKSKCPGLVVVLPHYSEYMKFSRLARQIYGRYTELVEPFGMDECWLDVSSSEKIMGDGVTIANEIRETVRRELGLTVSIGVSFNKIFAKLGSDMKKPDAVTNIPQDRFQDIIYGLPASDMLGVGRSTGKKLESYGIRTIGDMTKWPADFYFRRFGKNGVSLWRFAMGLDNSPVVPQDLDVPDKSVGHGITTREDLTENEEVYRTMLELCQEIGHRLHLYHKRATGVAVFIRDSDLMTGQWQCRLNLSTRNEHEIAKCAYSLFLKNYKWKRNIRSVTVRATGLVPETFCDSPDLFCDMKKIEKEEKIDDTVDAIRTRFGAGIIKSAVLLQKSKYDGEAEARIRMPSGIRTCRG